MSSILKYFLILGEFIFFGFIGEKYDEWLEFFFFGLLENMYESIIFKERFFFIFYWILSRGGFYSFFYFYF